jgi:hypothetical protein
MSNESENEECLIQIEEEQPAPEVKPPYVKPKKVMSTKQLEALAKGRKTRLNNKKIEGIEKELKAKPSSRKTPLQSRNHP